MNLSPNFDSTEFACKCGCGFCFPHQRLITALQKLRSEGTRPNPRVVGLVDRALGDNGELVRAMLRCRPQIEQFTVDGILVDCCEEEVG